MRPVLEIYSLPDTYRDLLHEYVRYNDGMIQGNNSFFTLDLSEYRDYTREGCVSGYLEYYGPYLTEFMQWFEKRISADEVLVLYWW